MRATPPRSGRISWAWFSVFSFQFSVKKALDHLVFTEN
jgi:hypothetical protein